MSELTPCNFCNLRRLRAYAAKNGKVVTLQYGRVTAGGFEGGVDALVHAPDETPDVEKHFLEWYMELTDYCCC
jgi:hypothetical protein